MSPTDFDRLCTLLAEKCPRLCWLNVGWNNLPDEVLPCLSTLPNLTFLELCGNPVGELGAMHVAKLPLTELKLQKTKIKGPGLAHISRMPNLKNLMLGENELAVADVRCLCAATSLRELDVQDNWLGAASIEVFASLLLTALNVSGNFIGDDASSHFKTMTSLCSLDVSDGVVPAVVEN
jgi:Leucine-rich repeat (LRR) protein